MSLQGRLAALEKSYGATANDTPGTVEWHMANGLGGFDPEVDKTLIPCELRAEHGSECVYSIAMHTNDGVRFMRIVTVSTPRPARGER